jgi:two-component system, NarL family, response regulator LiaR
MIRVVIIDVYKITCKGLRSMFHPARDGIHVIDSYQCAKEMITNVKEHLVDVLLFDLWIGKMDPIENLKTILVKFKGKPMLIFTKVESIEWARRTSKFGIKGYLLKSAEKPEIKLAIERVAVGGCYFSSCVSRPSIKNRELKSLERSIVALISEGYNQQKISEELRYSISTIKKTLFKLRSDFHCCTNSELVKVLSYLNFIP